MPPLANPNEIDLPIYEGAMLMFATRKEEKLQACILLIRQD